MFGSVFVSSAFRVVNAEKLISGLSAASAASPIMGKDLFSLCAVSRSIGFFGVSKLGPAIAVLLVCGLSLI